jgi:hypothetical protein
MKNKLRLLFWFGLAPILFLFLTFISIFSIFFYLNYESIFEKISDKKVDVEIENIEIENLKDKEDKEVCNSCDTNLNLIKEESDIRKSNTISNTIYTKNILNDLDDIDISDGKEKNITESKKTVIDEDVKIIDTLINVDLDTINIEKSDTLKQ